MKNRNVPETAGDYATSAEILENPDPVKKQNPRPDPFPLLQSRSAKISVPILDGLQMLNTEDIVKCVAQENATEIVLACGSKYRVSRNLKEYEFMLNNLNFFRIHNSCLINLRHVKKYIKGEGGFVLMSDDQCCEVSRRKKTNLINRLALVPL